MLTLISIAKMVNPDVNEVHLVKKVPFRFFSPLNCVKTIFKLGKIFYFRFFYMNFQGCRCFIKVSRMFPVNKPSSLIF
jgi:hypothetical protein